MGELKDLRRSTGAALCQECGKCSALCPLAHWGGFSARRIMGYSLEEELHAPGVGVQRCLTCGSCEIRCPQGVRYTEYVKGLREMIPREKRLSPPHHGVFQSAARMMADPGSPSRHPAWLEEGLAVAEEGPVALFVGCLPLFDEVFGGEFGMETVEIARSAVRLLNAVGIEPVLVGKERCCGHDLLWSGDGEVFEALARENAKAFQEKGIRRIVTTCAECCRTWRLDYPKAVPDYRPKVEHVSEFLADAVEDGGLRFESKGKALVTYQDPCRLGRHLEVYGAPRRVLRAIPETLLMEMSHTGRDALCCGTSGFIHCDTASKRLQQERLRNAADTGAGTLITACPKCWIHFRCAQKDAERRKDPAPILDIMDLTTFAASRLRGA